MLFAGTFQRGERIRIRVPFADFAAATSLSSNFKPFAIGRYMVPGAEIPIAGAFEVTTYAAVGALHGGFLLTLDAADNAIPRGRYVADVRFALGGDVQIEGPVAFNIINAVTAGSTPSFVPSLDFNDVRNSQFVPLMFL